MFDETKGFCVRVNLQRITSRLIFRLGWTWLEFSWKSNTRLVSPSDGQ